MILYWKLMNLTKYGNYHLQTQRTTNREKNCPDRRSNTEHLVSHTNALIFDALLSGRHPV